ncbi:MAG: nucleotide pyrophosphohydrolase [Planctomycetia bacterium]|nr:MAG: nucleotide pyrophosphohydrolase [Planctomycetia bacterium]
MHIREFQQLIEQMYSAKDRERGSARTFIWFVEEVGELARAIARRETDNLAGEFADVFAWLVTLANVEGVDLETAIRKFTDKGCPGCGQAVCTCTAKLT